MLPRCLSVSAWPLNPPNILNFFIVNTKLDTDIITLQKLQIPVFLFPEISNHNVVKSRPC
jgi:hypothetical protein